MASCCFVTTWKVLARPAFQRYFTAEDRERILGEAQRKEEELLESAEKRADDMVQQTEIIKQAELERDHMIDEAQEEARKIVYDAEDVADRIFGELEASLIEVKDSTDEILGPGALLLIGSRKS